MERTTILPYEWFNKSVRVAAYSGEERRPEIDNEGISEPQHVMLGVLTLGNGTETLGTNTLGINTPVQGSNLNGVKAIAAESDHNLAGW